MYGCSVWDVWKIFREGMEVRFGVESGENGRTKRADVPDVRADWTSGYVSASFAERKLNGSPRVSSQT